MAKLSSEKRKKSLFSEEKSLVGLTPEERKKNNLQQINVGFSFQFRSFLPRRLQRESYAEIQNFRLFIDQKNIIFNQLDQLPDFFEIEIVALRLQKKICRSQFTKKACQLVPVKKDLTMKIPYPK